MLLSAEEVGEVESLARWFLPEDSSSEDESDDESLELESDSGRGVLVAAFKAFLSSFFAESFSDSEDSDEESEEESELESELDSDELDSLLSLSEESESDEESDESDDSDEDFSALDSFAFLAFGASFSDEDSESDDEELVSAFRFTPVACLAAGAGVGADSSSSSSSASLSELDDDEEDEEEEEEEELGDFFDAFGASPISTSESLDSELLLLSSLSLLLDELGLADRRAFVPFWLSHVSKSWTSDGTLDGSGWDLVAAFPDCSFARASRVLSKPYSCKKFAMEVIKLTGGEVFFS